MTIAGYYRGGGIMHEAIEQSVSDTSVFEPVTSQTEALVEHSGSHSRPQPVAKPRVKLSDTKAKLILIASGGLAVAWIGFLGWAVYELGRSLFG
jgi:hypothetical protein